MRFSVAILITSLWATGCSKHVTPPPAVADQARIDCSGYGGFEESVCPVSIYKLIANPPAYQGRTVAFTGYVHRTSDGTIMVYPSREAASISDLASSVLCISDKLSCQSYVGKYAEVFGKFSVRSEPDFFFQPAGAIRLVYVRSTKNPVGL